MCDRPSDVKAHFKEICICSLVIGKLWIKMDRLKKKILVDDVAIHVIESDVNE